VIRDELEGNVATAARRRAAVELMSRHERSLKRTARRYSLDAEDVEDCFQRTLEIVLTKAPTSDPRELIRWAQTVIKHEALAVRRKRERLLGLTSLTGRDGLPRDPVAELPAPGAGPAEEAERREEVARTREALQALKPAELRALSLLAEGYSYAEIADITGFSLTKVNRSLAEGRERFRFLVSSSESGDRCRQLAPLLSAYCDGEAAPRDAVLVREHLRACPHCRVTMRTYRTTPRLAAALVPVPAVAPSLLARVKSLLGDLAARAGAVKGAAVWAAVAGSAAVGLGLGAPPNPLHLGTDEAAPPSIERGTIPALSQPRSGRKTADRQGHERERAKRPAAVAAADTEVEPTESVEYEAPVEAAPAESVAPPPPVAEPSAPSGSAAGEFGP
jgi:RNA polymerase sigma factor (sigma-70 family)